MLKTNSTKVSLDKCEGHYFQLQQSQENINFGYILVRCLLKQQRRELRKLFYLR